MQITCSWHQLEDVPHRAMTLLLLHHTGLSLCNSPEGHAPLSHGVTTTGLHYPQALPQRSHLSPRLAWIRLPSSPSGAGRGVPAAAAAAASGCGTLRARCHSLERRHGRLSSCQPLQGWQPLSPQPTEQSLSACPQAQHLLSSLSPKQVSSSALRCVFTAERGHTPGSAAVPATPMDS